MQLELRCVRYKYGIPKKQGRLTIKFIDYFDDEYFYDNDGSVFIISEKKANLVYDLMDDLNEQLAEKNINIQTYSIKCYFDISYSDYKGRNVKKLLIPENNSNQIIYHKDNRIRYCQDSILEEVESLNSFDIEIPIEYEKENLVITTHGMSDFKIKKKETLAEYLSEFIRQYFKQNSKIVEVEHNNHGFYKTDIKADELILDKSGFVIGFKEIKKKKINKIFCFLVALCIIILMSVTFKCIRKYRKKKHGKNKNKKRNHVKM